MHNQRKFFYIFYAITISRLKFWDLQCTSVELIHVLLLYMWDPSLLENKLNFTKLQSKDKRKGTLYAFLAKIHFIFNMIYC